MSEPKDPFAEFSVVGDGMADVWLTHRAKCEWGTTVTAGSLKNVVQRALDHWAGCESETAK